MNNSVLVFREEWRFWSRSRLAGGAFAIMTLVLLGSVIHTWSYSTSESERRANLQEQAETAFLSQPARHPHRMVHYGHYAFRTPVPLSALDPGIDPFSGTVLFLEGHRQNSAMFAEASELSSLTRFGSLSPAFALQVLAPLLLVIMGFSGISRERENSTLIQLQASGVGSSSLLAGKALALLSVVGLLLLPLAVAGLLLVPSISASPAAVLMLVLVHGVYLMAWALGTTAVSALVRTSAASLAVLLLVWTLWVIVLPKFASSLARGIEPIPGKIASDLYLLTDEELADGHNAADPGFAVLTAQLLDTYDVDDVADLPMNIRGIVSSAGEAAATEKLNEYAQQRLSDELNQAHVVDRLALLSPLLAIRRASMALAGTDLEHQHRFLREAEELRFSFVQGLNTLHAEELAYSDDIKRSADATAEQRTRVDASNWRLLPEFHFSVAPAGDRIISALPMTALLIAWTLTLLGLCALIGKRVRP
jgi:ABC-2 type transport system permease protein